MLVSLAASQFAPLSRWGASAGDLVLDCLATRKTTGKWRVRLRTNSLAAATFVAGQASSDLARAAGVVVEVTWPSVDASQLQNVLVGISPGSCRAPGPLAVLKRLSSTSHRTCMLVLGSLAQTVHDETQLRLPPPKAIPLNAAGEPDVPAPWPRSGEQVRQLSWAFLFCWLLMSAWSQHPRNLGFGFAVIQQCPVRCLRRS